jgi:dienelactone hydrolase
MEQQNLRQAILARLGSFPLRTMLAIKTESTQELEDHTRSLITYAVETGERVSAWLLTPKGSPPRGGWPALLAIHQHAGQFDLGKSEPAGLLGTSEFHYGLDLCKRGYVVLCPDLLCFEDRRPPEEVRQAEQGRLEGKAYELFTFTRLLLHGSCLQTKYLHDLRCGLDVLSALPHVDAHHLGTIGHSLGGQEALWLSWYDERVTVGVSSCGFSTIETILRDGINHNLALYVPGLLELGDLDALLTAIAPRAFLLTAGEADPIFPLDGVRSLAAKAQVAYTQAGVAECFRAVIFPQGHAFPNEVKAQAYAFLDQWLK